MKQREAKEIQLQVAVDYDENGIDFHVHEVGWKRNGASLWTALEVGSCYSSV